MTKFTRRALGLVSAASLVALTAGGAMAQDKRTIAVSIPAATHGWTCPPARPWTPWSSCPSPPRS